MYNANEGLAVVGLVIIVWSAFTYFGLGFSRQTLLDKFSRKYEILDEKALLKNDLFFRLLLGISAMVISVLEQYHGSLPITLLLLTIAFVVILSLEKKRRLNFLKPKEPNNDKE